MNEFPMRCEGCHKVVWTDPRQWTATQFDKAAQWYCEECNNQDRIFTLADIEREERE